MKPMHRSLKQFAHHEAGHAVIACAYGFVLKEVTIVASETEGYGGYMDVIGGSSKNKPRIIAARMVYTLAGGIAQARYAHRSIDTLGGGHVDMQGFSLDLYHLRTLTGGENSLMPSEQHFTAFKRVTRLAVAQYWPAIQGFAAVLIERKTIGGAEAEAIIDSLIFDADCEGPPVLDEVISCRAEVAA